MAREVRILQLLLLAAIFGLAQAAEESRVVWVWSGGITPTEAVVKAKIADSTSAVRLLLSSEDSDGEVVAVTPKTHYPSGVASFGLEDLQPETSYSYGIEVDGKVHRRGKFRTFRSGPMSFRLAFASCSSTGSNHRIYDTIRQSSPLFFLHMGDFHYEDIAVNDPERFRRAFDRSLTTPRQADFWQAVPIAYVWDDHDYGPDDSDRTSPSRMASLKVYDEYIPHYPLVRTGNSIETIQQAFTVGRIRFILTDLRAARDPGSEPDGPEKSMLGSSQLMWFFAELERAAQDFPLLVWVNSVPWITRNEPGSDRGWEPYSYERRLIADRIQELGLERKMLMLSGDGHMVAIDDGRNSDYSTSARPGSKSFPVFHAAPIDRFPRVKGGPYSHGAVAPRKFFGLDKIQQFGLVDFEDDGSRIQMDLRGLNAKGELLPGMNLVIDCPPSGCVGENR